MSYRVVVHDDLDHSYDYVIELFTSALEMTAEEAFDAASAIDRAGRFEIPASDLDGARSLEERLLSGGPDPRLERCRTSLTVSTDEITNGEARTLSCGRVGPHGYEPMDLERVERLRREPEDAAVGGVPRVDGRWPAGLVLSIVLVLLIIGVVWAIDFVCRALL